jgi:hypothetical protein
MKSILSPQITRRTFLKGTGAAAGALGFSTFTGGLWGCDPPEPVKPLLYGGEMVGRVTSGSSTVHLVGGETCTPSTRFRLLYDTVSRVNPVYYASSTPEISGFGPHDPIQFDLDSLSPGSRTYYRVATNDGSGWKYRNEYSFTTRRPAGQGFRFCLGADAHVSPLDFYDGGRRQVFTNILNDRPDLLFSLGDELFLAYQTETVYPWPSQEEIWNTTRKTRNILDLACHSMSYLPLNGNHEGLFGWTQERTEYQEIMNAKLAYFPLPHSGTFPEGGDPLGRYGAFTWGDALFLWLDVVGFCTVDPWLQLQDNAKYILGAEQTAFLQETLASHASVPWKFIFSHHLFGGVDACGPGYGRGNAHGALLHDQALVHDLMQIYGVQAFFYGHDHVYSVSEADSTVYICAGNAASGCLWVEELDACYDPYLAFAVDSYRAAIPGHVRVDVGADTATISYVVAGTNNGTVYHSHVISR